MAIRRTSSNSISNAVKLSTGFASAAIPNTPTIGVATAVSDVAATVAYTAAVLGATASTFTATSNPGSVTGTGSSPITVTGLTASTAYTFTVTAGNANGTSAASSASNSITTSAPSGSYQSIATVTVGAGGQSTIEFTSIPSTFTHLQIRGILRNTAASASSSDLFMTFNGDTSTNYRAYKQIGGDGSSGFAAASDSAPAATNSIRNAYFLNDGNTAGVYSAWTCDILDYRNTNKYKVTRCLNGQDLNGSGSIRFLSGLWQSTSVITSIELKVEFGSNFKQYTQFALYGIKGA